MTKTALEVASSMTLPAYAAISLMNPDLHPQERTEMFHRFYEAPIYNGPIDKTFSHMDDQRVAFRMAFILSEAFEILEKGLGLDVQLGLNGAGGKIYVACGSSNSSLTDAVLAAMQDGGQRDIIEVVDGLGDLNVVVNGFALELGADMLEVDLEVSASNFTKADEDGNPMVSDGTDGHPKGKVLKGPNFTEPNIRAVLGLSE